MCKMRGKGQPERTTVMNDKTTIALGFYIVMAFLGVLSLGILWGSSMGKDDIRREAVEKGKAEYYVDDKYELKWRWKP